jgi:REP element-mobilizing transposase RayT
MLRIARVTLQNAYYHIITRGNQKQNVFLEAKVRTVPRFELIL